MTTVTEITIFNARVDKEERRDVFVPTVISGASFLESKSSSRSKGLSDEKCSFKIRIPFNAHGAQGYVRENVYKQLDDITEHWTIRKGDYILTAAVETDRVTQKEIEELAASVDADLISITEYADNTIRGTNAVKHWRIGGV